ncbi:MAG: phosphoenolpyruvate carboxykinase [Candidatus Helarchaeota archaeon]|nr:phosphoenolpyruvate carboxykinase [Candidatus Helarchaeota archaeon]
MVETLHQATDISLEKVNELITLAGRYLGFDSVFMWNVNINGFIIQLQTNDTHLEDFWRENFFPAPFESNLRPHGIIYAITGVYNAEPSVYFNAETNTGFLINITAYRQLRSLALGMVLDMTEDQKNLHFVRGSLIDINGEGFAFMGPPGSGINTHTFLLLEMERARIHSLDWIYVEQIGGEKGRISTNVSERKFYLKNNIVKLIPRLKILYEKCKKDEDNFILDPWWIGGKDKYITTTRINVIFLLNPDPAGKEIIRRLTKREALARLTGSDIPFFNPHVVVINEMRKDQQFKFFDKLFDFIAVYSINTAKPMFEVQKAIKNVILSKSYLEPIQEEKQVIQIEIEEALKQINLEEIKREVANMLNSSNVEAPSEAEIRKMAEKYGTRTKFSNYNYVSTVKNRSAEATVYIGSPKVVLNKLNERQREIVKTLPKTIKEVLEYIKKAPFIRTSRTMCENPTFTPTCTLFVSVHRKEMVRLSHMINLTLFPPKKNGKNSDLFIVYIPEWQEKDRQIVVFPEIGVTFVLGSDYYGEAKKGFLRMAMWMAKEKGMLGLHAGAKLIKARDVASGQIKRYSALIFGLTATGKTTHSCHSHDLNEADGEGIEIVQDDFVALRPDGSALGTERGFYLKTEGLNPEIQPLIYNAITKPDAVFENVLVDYKGEVFFESDMLTGNGRGIMQKKDFGKYSSEGVNVPPLSEVDGLLIFLITRRHTIVPIASKLTIEQAAAAFMLGESIETSGSNPKKAGESVRVVGTNPFIVGNEAEEGNWFYNFLKENEDRVQCYLLNTGGIGEVMEVGPDGTKILKRKVSRIPIKEMASIIRGIARNSIEWVAEPYFGTLIPNHVEGVDMSQYNPAKFYSPGQLKEMIEKFKKERKDYLASFKKLDEKIVNAFK